MQSNPRKTLAVIGAGPKGIAVALKAKVLEEFGIPVDKVVIIEKNDVAAHWTGEHGYTNGDMKLGTSPERDLVFPIDIDVGDDALNYKVTQRLLQFTWGAFLVHTHQYADWIDRGRLAPSHGCWSAYLRWVMAQLMDNISIISAEVLSVDLTADERGWQLCLKDKEAHVSYLTVDKLMITGPAKAKMSFVCDQALDASNDIYDLESVWCAIRSNAFIQNGKIAIIGAGENSASILLALASYAPQLQIDIISPKGFLSTRGDSYYENQFYSEPGKTGWNKIALSHRSDFISRTDLGVFSLQAMTLLNDQAKHTIIPGRATHLTYKANELQLTSTYMDVSRTYTYDSVILATGFDYTRMLTALLTDRAKHHLSMAMDNADLNQHNIEIKIGADLSITSFYPKLYLPMLASLMQGPGFSNLSCLGLLSDRVLLSPACIHTGDEGSIIR